MSKSLSESVATVFEGINNSMDRLEEENGRLREHLESAKDIMTGLLKLIPDDAEGDTSIIHEACAEIYLIDVELGNIPDPAKPEERNEQGIKKLRRGL